MEIFEFPMDRYNAAGIVHSQKRKRQRRYLEIDFRIIHNIVSYGAKNQTQHPFIEYQNNGHNRQRKYCVE